MAWKCFVEPSILKAGDYDEIVIDSENGQSPEPVSVQDIKQAYIENRELILFFEDWKKGLFSISFLDYMNLPVKLLDAKRYYDSISRIVEKT